MNLVQILSYTTSDFPGLDVLRLIAAMGCLWVATLAARIIIGGRRESAPATLGRDRDSAIARLVAMIILGTIEIQQIGSPFLPWRLPLIYLCLFFCFRVTWRRI